MIGRRLRAVAQAISEYEGWRPAGTFGGVERDGTPAWRNHNPGNLRSSPFQCGERGGFALFYDDHVGMMSLLYDLWIKATDRSKTGLTSKSTLRELMLIYAPPSENDTESYIQFIVNKTGFPATMTLGELVLE